jgi:ferritin-like metal-binding protein YciE
MLKNACEDSQHGGMYGAMLGQGKEADAEFWKQVVGLYRLEANAEAGLRKMAGEMRAAGEEELAACVESTIEEENEHARRLKAVFEAHGIEF